LREETVWSAWVEEGEAAMVARGFATASGWERDHEMGRERWGEQDWGTVGDGCRGTRHRREQADGAVASREIFVVYEAAFVRTDARI
jgi:hypothetical protein